MPEAICYNCVASTSSLRVIRTTGAARTDCPHSCSSLWLDRLTHTGFDSDIPHKKYDDDLIQLVDYVIMHDVRYIDDDDNTQKGSVHGKGLCIVSCRSVCTHVCVVAMVTAVVADRHTHYWLQPTTYVGLVPEAICCHGDAIGRRHLVLSG